MTKEKLAIEVIKRLKTAYPRTDCTLVRRGLEAPRISQARSPVH